MRLTSVVLLTALLALAGITVWRSPWGYATQDRMQTAAGSSATHPAGTDELGEVIADLGLSERAAAAQKVHH